MTAVRMPRRELPDPYSVKIVLDSIAPHGRRLTTWALTYPRFVHAELMTHRCLSRNSASSRAIPNEKLRKLVLEHPALPIWWGKNQSGMQAREELGDVAPVLTAADWGTTMSFDTLSPLGQAKRVWLEARDIMLEYSARLSDLGLHKQLCNRLIEPWMPITVLVSATEWGNWFHLRDHKDAQPEIQIIATEMHYQYHESVSQHLGIGEWHLPFIRQEDREEAVYVAIEEHQRDGLVHTAEEVLRKVSTGRCARVSYLNHEGIRDLREDIKLHDRLASTAESQDPGHFSPFEHPAEVMWGPTSCGNFVGFRQYRKYFSNEAGPLEVTMLPKE